MENLKVLFPVHIREKIKDDGWMDGLEEIRIRVNQPIELEYADETRCLTNADDKITGADIAEMLSYISEYSLYAYQEELRQGYITIEGDTGSELQGKSQKTGKGLQG